jgi:enamine deaminase RidA (YjgF/YER057c/UK114 family)
MRVWAVLIMAIAASGCVAIDASGSGGDAGTRRETIIPSQMQTAYDTYHFAPATRAGDFIFVSGVVAGLREGQNDEAALDASFDRAFRGVALVLGEAGADWGDVVEMTTYHTDLPAQFEVFSRVKDRFVATPYPSWTAIDVDRLLPDQGIVEIRVTAYAPRD